MSKGFFLNNKQLEKIIEDANFFIKKNYYGLSYAVKIAIKNNLGDLDREDWSSCYRKVAGEIKKRESMKESHEKSRERIESRLRDLEILQRAKELRDGGDPEYAQDDYSYLNDINFKLSEKLIKNGGDIVRYSQMGLEAKIARTMHGKEGKPKRCEAVKQKEKNEQKYIQGKISFK